MFILATGFFLIYCNYFFSIFLCQNIEKGNTYKVALYVRSSGSINVSLALTASNRLQKLAAANIVYEPIAFTICKHCCCYSSSKESFFTFFIPLLLCRESASEVSDWKKIELVLEAKGTNSNSSLQLTTTSKGVIWFDQVSVMPLDTYRVLYFPMIPYTCFRSFVSSIFT